MSNVKLITNCRNWNCKISRVAAVAVLRVHGGSVLSGPGQKTILVHLLVLVLVLAGDTLTIYGLAAAGGEAGRGAGLY